MPLIEPENKKRPQKICVSLTFDAYDELSQYCRFLNSSCDYVIGALVHQVLPKDREFQNWKATPQAALPSGEVIKKDGRGRRKHTGGDGSPKAVNIA